VDQWVWWGNEVRSEARFVLDKRLKPRLESIGSDISQAVHCTVYLNEIEDLFELDLVWREVWPDHPPATRTAPPRWRYSSAPSGRVSPRSGAR
jgi:enamine deaminase RidA (YjgF/YER057c/UK114 family)